MNSSQKILKYSPRYYEPNLEDVTYLNLNASSICNFRCMKCMQSEAVSVRPHSEPIDFLKLIDRARDELGVRALYLSGSGETFLVGLGNHQNMLNNYKELVKHANELEMDIVQFTNGYYLTREMVEFLMDYRVSLVVSIDTLDTEKYSLLTGTGPEVFQKVIDNIQFARMNFPVTPSDGNAYYRLGINMAISHICLDDIKLMMSFCGDDIIFFSNYRSYAK